MGNEYGESEGDAYVYPSSRAMQAAAPSYSLA